jgi:competence protein ComFC
VLFVARCPGCGAIHGGWCVGCWNVLVTAPVVHRAGILVSHEYSGALRELIVAMKYASARWVVPMVADLWVVRHGEVCDVDVVTWAPTTRRRMRERGYDQSELIARRVARRLGKPCRAMLRRTDDGAQTGRSARERNEGSRFVARRTREVRVLLLDDVVTTGATLRHGVDALHDIGVRQVTCGAIAATPAPEGRR